MRYHEISLRDVHVNVLTSENSNGLRFAFPIHANSMGASLATRSTRGCQGTGISESSDSAASVAAANLIGGKWWDMVGGLGSLWPCLAIW